MTKVYVLSCDPYEVKDDNGAINAGFTIWFLNRYRDNTNESRGHKPARVSMKTTDGIAQKLMQTELPAVCDIDLDVRPGAQNKLTAQIVGLQVLAPVPLEKIFAAVPPSPAR